MKWVDKLLDKLFGFNEGAKKEDVKKLLNTLDKFKSNIEAENKLIENRIIDITRRKFGKMALCGLAMPFSVGNIFNKKISLGGNDKNVIITPDEFIKLLNSFDEFMVPKDPFHPMGAVYAGRWAFYKAEKGKWVSEYNWFKKYPKLKDWNDYYKD